MNQVKQKRISSNIQKALCEIILEESRDSILKAITITACEVTNDLSFCKVYFTSLEQDDHKNLEKELEEKIKNKDFLYEDVLGDIIISIDKVKEQAEEYGHSFERELSYMLVHGFYHLMGYDHIKEEDKAIMRPKEEKVLNKLGITREDMNE